MILQQLADALGNDVEVIAFGSRVKGTARQFSDLDVLLNAPTPLSYAALAEAEELLAESDLPFSVDLLDKQRVTAEFLQRIEPELQLIGRT